VQRRRSLTILASTTTAVVLAAAPASAQLGGVVDTVTGAVDDLADELGLAQDSNGCFIDLTEEEREQLLAIDGDLCTRLKETTQPVDEATKQATDTAKATTEKATEPVKETAPAPDPPSDGGSSGGDGGGSSDGGSTATAADGASGGGPAAPSEASAERAAEPERVEQLSSEQDRERRMATLRALRSDISSGVLRADTGVLGPVGPGVAGIEGSSPDLAAPEVADGELTSAVADGAAPEVADSGGILATSGPLGSGADVPLALQVLAGALVLGSGAVWTLARREVGDGPLIGES
jgi:hypothetical protein